MKGNEMAKPATLPADAAAPAKSNKVLIIIFVILWMATAAGGGWYFAQNAQTKQHEIEEQAAPEPRFIALETFTVNLQHEVGDQYLQVGITLKIEDPSLEERIKQHLPEIRSRLLLLLSGKYPSELAVTKGKKELARQIVAEVKQVLGLSVALPGVAQEHTAETAISDAQAAPVESAQPAEAAQTQGNDAYIEVLFTSFIIQ